MGETPNADRDGDTTDDRQFQPRKSPSSNRDVNDPRGDHPKLKREYELIEQMVYPEDAEEVRKWAISLDGEPGTLAGYIGDVRTLSNRSAEWRDIPLVAMEKHDLDDLIQSHEDGRHPSHHVPDDGQSHGKLRNFQTHARMFFRDHLGREWAANHNFSVRSQEQGKITADDLLTTSEITRLFQAAPNQQVKALMGVLLVVGLRISATLSLRVGDVDVSGRTGFITINDNATGLKGMTGRRPLIWATAYVTNWLDVHPARDDPDAPLFCAVKDGQSHERGDAFSTEAARDRLRKLADRADVDESKVNPHNFRHTAITRMVKDGLAEQEIKWMVGWSRDSGQFDRYVHLKDEEMIATILDDYDLSDPEREVGQPHLTECPKPSCRVSLRPGAAYCPGCGGPLSHGVDDSYEKVETLGDAIGDDVVLTDDRELRIGKRALEAVLSADDDLKAALAAEFVDADSDAETT